MDNLTKLVRDEISRQYRSVRQFAFSVDIPLSTINSALHNGVGGSSFDTVMRICKILGIKAMSDEAAQNRHEPPSRSGRRFFCCKRHIMPDFSLLAAMAAFSLRAG